MDIDAVEDLFKVLKQGLWLTMAILALIAYFIVSPRSCC